MTQQRDIHDIAQRIHCCNHAEVSTAAFDTEQLNHTRHIQSEVASFTYEHQEGPQSEAELLAHQRRQRIRKQHH